MVLGEESGACAYRARGRPIPAWHRPTRLSPAGCAMLQASDQRCSKSSQVGMPFPARQGRVPGIHDQDRGFAALIAGRAARAYRARPSSAKATGKPVIGIDASPGHAGAGPRPARQAGMSGRYSHTTRRESKTVLLVRVRLVSG